MARRNIRSAQGRLDSHSRTVEHLDDGRGRFVIVGNHDAKSGYNITIGSVDRDCNSSGIGVNQAVAHRILLCPGSRDHVFDFGYRSRSPVRVLRDAEVDQAPNRLIRHSGKKHVPDRGGGKVDATADDRGVDDGIMAGESLKVDDVRTIPHTQLCVLPNRGLDRLHQGKRNLPQPQRSRGPCRQLP